MLKISVTLLINIISIKFLYYNREKQFCILLFIGRNANRKQRCGS